MGCGGSKSAEIQRLTEQQQQSMKKQEQIASQQQQQIKMQAEALENARSQQEITARQFEEQKSMLTKQQEQLIQQQQEALQMALLAKQQAEQAANSAAEQALKKAEDLKRKITPPPKPGKVNILIQTIRTIPPNAIMKRRKQKDAFGNVIDRPNQDHREECGGVGSDAVDTPNVAQIPVMVARAKDNKGDDDDDDEYEYQYEYQYQYQYTDDMPAGPKAMIAPQGGLDVPKVPPPAATQPLFTKQFAPASSKESIAEKAPAPVPANRPPITVDPDDKEVIEDDYEYEYEED